MTPQPCSLRSDAVLAPMISDFLDDAPPANPPLF